MKILNTINIVLLFNTLLILTGCSNLSGSNKNKQGTRSSENSSQSINNEYNGYEITNEGAWCWFADPRALHYENKSGTINATYIGYIDVHGNIKATQHNFKTGETAEVLIRSYFQPDDHNNPSFLVLPDERIMIFYSRHTDEAYFYYRVSQKPGDITSLGAENKIETNYSTTYPSPFILSDDPTHFYLCWRGIKWHPTIARFTLPDNMDQVHLEWGPYLMIQSTAARPYCKYYSNGKDKIYLAYTTGHPDNEYPNYLYFNYIDINTYQLKDIEGAVLSTIEKGPHFVNKTDYPTQHPAAVVDCTSDKRNWVWQTVIDKDGFPAIAMVQINKDKSDHNYYYAKWTGTNWRKTFIANGGGHFHQSEEIELCYSGGMTIDDSKPNEVYCSVPISVNSSTVYEIVKYTLNSNGVLISSKPITHNSEHNNARPLIINNSSNTPLRLVWMNGNYYDWMVSSFKPQGFPTAIHSNYTLPNQQVNLDSELIVHKNIVKDKKLSGTANKDLNITLSDSITNSLTVSITTCIRKEANDSTILKIGNLIYGISSINQKPYIIIDNAIYNSSNLLGNSDIWKTKDRCTDGMWYPPQTQGTFNLTITCNKNLLKTYRNGLIDQVIELSSPILANMVQGGSDVYIKDYYIYNRALNQNEIKELTRLSLKSNDQV